MCIVLLGGFNMHKKLYKAKKNWVIGLIAGSILFFGTATGVEADANMSNTENQGSTQIENVVDQSDQKWISQKVANNQPGQYNDQNVGYIDPTHEVGYSDTPDIDNGNSTDDTDYQYYSKENKKVFDGNGTDLIDTYGKPKVYAYNGNDKQLADNPQPYKHVAVESISNIPTVNNGTYHYLNNGASNAVQFNQNSRSLNYANINEMSQYLSSQDYLRLKESFASPSQEQDLRSLFNDTKNSKGQFEPKRIVKPGKHLTTKELNDLYDAAYDNRPKITFDKKINGKQITSLLQTSVNAIDVNWHLNFETGWHGWTFQNGSQLSLADILRPEDKNFSWKNTVSRYIFQALKFKKFDGVSGLFGTMALDKQGLPVSSLENNTMYKGNTDIAFMQDGVYAILSSIQQGYNPVLVRLPMAFLKPEYQAFYDSNDNVVKNVKLEYRNQDGELIKDFSVQLDDNNNANIDQYNLKVELDHTQKLKNGAEIYVVNHIINKKNTLNNPANVVTFNVSTTRYTTVYLIDKSGKDAAKNKILKKIHLKGAVDVKENLSALDYYIPDGFTIINQSAIQYDPDKWFAEVFVGRSDEQGNLIDTDPNAYNHYTTNDDVDVKGQNTDFENEGIRDEFNDAAVDTGADAGEAQSISGIQGVLQKYSVKMGDFYNKVKKNGFDKDNATEFGEDLADFSKDFAIDVLKKDENGSVFQGENPVIQKLQKFTWAKVEDAAAIAKDSVDSITGAFDDYNDTVEAESRFDPQKDKEDKKDREKAFRSQRKGELSHIKSTTSLFKDGILAGLSDLPDWVKTIVGLALGVAIVIASKFIWAATETEKAARLYRIRAKNKLRSEISDNKTSNRKHKK